MCSPASVILAMIVTILVSFEAILIYFKAHGRNIALKLTSEIDIYRNPLQNCFETYKYCDHTCEYYTCRWTHFASIGSILVSIITILTSSVTILVSIEQMKYEYTLSNFLVKTLHSRNFCQKRVRVNFRNYHKVSGVPIHIEI